jgi:hypothetical protein
MHTNDLRSIKHTADLLLEVVGQVEVNAVQNAVGNAFEVSVWPYARLGDATVRLHTLESNLPSDAEVIHCLERAGLTILGARHAA